MSTDSAIRNIMETKSRYTTITTTTTTSTTTTRTTTTTEADPVYASTTDK